MSQHPTPHHAAPPLSQAPLARVLRALALGEASAEALLEAQLAAATADQARGDSGLHAWAHLDADGARVQARASDLRREAGQGIGRLDGVTVAVSEPFDVAGLPGRLGLPGPGRVAAEDAAAVARLRAAGAVLPGKTAIDEAGFGGTGHNLHHGDIGNPRHPGQLAGGASGGAAAAVAAGHATLAIGADTLGGCRLPAAFCGLVALRPTAGEVSVRGMATGLRRLDAVGLLAREVADLGVLLQVLAGYDAGDPRTRARRQPFAPPDWQPGRLRVGVLDDLPALGASGRVVHAFEAALAAAGPVLGQAAPARLDLAALDLPASRRAALLLMEAELLAAHGARLEGASAGLTALLDFARARSAIDYVLADRRLDALVVQARALFTHHDVLLLPTAPMPPPPRDAGEHAGLADFCALASLAGCPALSLPLPGGIGLQLVGPRGSDLRLLELGEVLASVIAPWDP